MLGNAKHRLTSRPKRAVAVGLTVAAVGGGLVGILAPNASATLGDSNVNVSGGAGCRTFLYLASNVSFTLENGETASSGFSLFHYSVKFHDIPATGTSGVATVTCSEGSNSYTYQRAVSINRPVANDNVSLNLAAG